jgi:hypothetical protein
LKIKRVNLQGSKTEMKPKNLELLVKEMDNL